MDKLEQAMQSADFWTELSCTSFGKIVLHGKNMNEDAGATDPDEESLLDSEIEYIQNAYMFMPYAFLKACEDIVEYTGLSFEGRHTRIYKLKDGCKIKVTAG